MKTLKIAKVVFCFFTIMLPAAVNAEEASATGPSIVSPAPTTATIIPARPSKIRLAIIDRLPKVEFEKYWSVVFQEELKNCKNCEWMNATPYNKEGQFDPEKIKSQVDGLDSVQVILFTFNEKSKKEHQEWVDILHRQSIKGVTLIASAGVPKDDETSAPLKKTVFGSHPDFIVIGDLNERERLSPMGFFGPEMLTGIRNPKSMAPHDGLGAALFAIRLTSQWSKRSDWATYLRDKRAKMKRLWPDLNDFFY